MRMWRKLGRDVASFALVFLLLSVPALVVESLAQIGAPGIWQSRLLGISTKGLEGFWVFGDPNGRGKWYQPRRNLLKASEDLTSALWTKTNATATATTFTPSAQNGGVTQSVSVSEGIQYTLSATIASAGNTSLEWVACGDYVSLSVTASEQRYSVTFTAASTGSCDIGLRDPNTSGFGAVTFTNVQLEVGTTATTYQPTGDDQVIWDWSGNGNHLQNGSSSSSDTNDASLVTPSSRNVAPIEYVSDLSQWYLSGGTRIDSHTITINPGAYIGFWSNTVANTYSAFCVDVEVTSGGAVDVKSSYSSKGSHSTGVTSGRHCSFRGGRASAMSPIFSGTGLDDLTPVGTSFTCAVDYLPDDNRYVAYYLIKIDGEGSPDTFSWSHDNGATWQATNVPITGETQELDCGISIRFSNTTGHTLGDQWEILVYYQFSMVAASSSNSEPVTVKITNLQVEYCSSLDCSPTPYTDPATESVVAGARFDGVDDYIADGAEQAGDHIGSWTFVVRGVPSTGTAVYSEGNDSSSAQGFRLETSEAALRVVLTDDAGATLVDAITTNGVFDGAIHVVTVVLDAGSYAVYVDGSLDTSGSYTPTTVTVNKAAIGAITGPSYSGFFNGTVIGGKVASRALSAAEVGSLHRNLAYYIWNWRAACPDGYRDTICQNPPLYAFKPPEEVERILRAQAMLELANIFPLLASPGQVLGWKEMVR